MTRPGAGGKQNRTENEEEEERAANDRDHVTRQEYKGRLKIRFCNQLP